MFHTWMVWVWHSLPKIGVPVETSAAHPVISGHAAPGIPGQNPNPGLHHLCFSPLGPPQGGFLPDEQRGPAFGTDGELTFNEPQDLLCSAKLHLLRCATPGGDPVTRVAWCDTGRPSPKRSMWCFCATLAALEENEGVNNPKNPGPTERSAESDLLQVSGSGPETDTLFVWGPGLLAKVNPWAIVWVYPIYPVPRPSGWFSQVAGLPKISDTFSPDCCWFGKHPASLTNHLASLANNPLTHLETLNPSKPPPDLRRPAWSEAFL